jgi:hypothetical protein
LLLDPAFKLEGEPNSLHQGLIKEPEPPIAADSNLDDHLNFDEPRPNESAEDYQMIQPKSLIPGVVSGNHPEEPLSHDLAVEEPIEQYVHGNHFKLH